MTAALCRSCHNNPGSACRLFVPSRGRGLIIEQRAQLFHERWADHRFGRVALGLQKLLDVGSRPAPAASGQFKSSLYGAGIRGRHVQVLLQRPEQQQRLSLPQVPRSVVGAT